jgi:alkylhydroperoxidase family enzyme
VRHLGEPAIAALIIEIVLINVWNRLNATTRQPAGAWEALSCTGHTVL